MAALKNDHAHYITVSGKRLPLIVKKHPRARNLVVRYDTRRDCVKVTAPRYVSLKRAVEFAESKTEWIARQREKTSTLVIENGAMVSIFGQEIRLAHAGGRGVASLVEGVLQVTGAAEFMPRRVRDYVLREMRIIAHERALFHAAKLGVRVSSLTLRDTSSRWGSCTRSGRISLCWRLAFAPYEVMDYVVAHEVAHLLHHNHSPSFWHAVAHLCPAYEMHEHWLKTHGHKLMASWGI
jgi:predicted metal-dependent hydrolase